ncbi:GNAT family N-acetyltransferase [Slackia heliotrinireducens]|uniref:GNAT family N-acetyltransferase n=1 Tax=Slackia heliotrinireducens TaxID=84110 RepID=UPI003315652A
MMNVKDISFDELTAHAARLGLALPIEQTEVWARYQETIPGRTPWGVIAVCVGDTPIAFASLFKYAMRGYTFLRSHHGLLWAYEPSEQEERDALEAVAKHVHARERGLAFIRFGVLHDLDICRPVLSSIPYDTTVVMDISGDQDDIIGRMKKRGRRDVRKALRESPIACTDETEAGMQDFSEYYDVMRETAERDGFSPSPMSDYQDMLRILGLDHVRLFVGRIDGKVVNWEIDTMNDGHAVRYYAASRSEFARLLVADRLLLHACVELSRLGCTTLDHMGMGSDAFPGLNSLNTFKTKFSENVAHVAPDRDLPLRKGFYTMLSTAKSTVASHREKAAAEAAAPAAKGPREDLISVIIGGDIGAYALGREMHEAFGIKSICLASAPIGAISHSKIFDVKFIERISPENIIAAATEIAEANPDKSIFLYGNTDSTIVAINGAQDRLPANVYSPVPPNDVVEQVSDKVTFHALCQNVGIDVPKTEVVKLAGTDAIPASEIPFPSVAKPAASAKYDHLYAKGFKKVYYVHEQAELDQLWKDLREVGFEGDFLVQELIGGDDTWMDSLSLYVAEDGTPIMFGSSQVLLEDHAPTMLGNPVAMITRPMPEHWEKAARLLTSIGYKGFCNIDIKRDPATGRVLFLDLNPRIGRNSYYNCAAGVNPMEVAVLDLIDHAAAKRYEVKERILYTLVPLSLLDDRYLSPELVAEVNQLKAEGKVFDPQRYDKDAGIRRMIDVELTERNQIRKFGQFYPKATETSF